jgi:polysaccharide deacetylase 2 family uncharacterized protein YibQ
MSQKTKNVITEIVTGLGLAQSIVGGIPHLPQWVGVALAAAANVLNEILKETVPSP